MSETEVHAGRRVVRVEVGGHVLYEGDRWKVASLGANSVLLRSGARASVRVSVDELVSNGVLPVETMDDDDASGSAVTPLDALPEEQQAQAVERAEMLTLMRTGYRKGGPEHPGDAVDPRFHPSLPKGHRERALGALMGISDRQVRTWAAAYDTYGPVGLVNGRLGQTRRPLGACDDRVRDAILHVLDDQTDRSKTNAVNTRRSVRDRLVEQHAAAVEKALAAGKDAPEPPGLPAPSTFRKYLAELGRGRGRSLAAKQMRSIANRPKRAYGRFTAVRPFEVVLIDSSPVDMFCMDIVTGKWQRVVLTLAMDLFSRSIVAWRFTPGDPDRNDACLLLHDMVSPKPVGEDWDPIARWRYGVPENIVVDPGMHEAAGLPFGWPEQVLVDHGKIFLAHDFTEACRVLGIDVQYARPYTPTDKAHIERLFRTVREQFWELLPGYKGPDVWSRGAKSKVEAEAFLFFHELEELFAEWVATDYQNNKHEGLQLSSQPSYDLTPNEMFDHGTAVAGFQRLVVDPDLFIELLPTEWRTVQHYGVEMNLVRYNGDALDGFRNRKSAWGAKEGKWRFKADPRDLSTVYFWRPEDLQDPDSPGAWSVLRRVGDNGRIPFTAAELAYAKRLVLAEGGSPRSADLVAAAVDRVIARTRSLDPAVAEERRLAARAIVRDHQAQRDRGADTPRTWDPADAGPVDGPDAPSWDTHAGRLATDRTDRFPVPSAGGDALVDLDEVTILGTPDEVEFDPFEDLPEDALVGGGYETVGDE